MNADAPSPASPEPEVFRPRRLLIWVSVASLAIVLLAIGSWIGLGREVRALFSPGQLLTLLLLMAFAVGFLMALGLCVARADAVGVRWRNGLRSHRLAWSEVLGVRYRQGDPWVYLLTAGPAPDDLLRRPVMAIQSTDRRDALDKAERLRALWRQGHSG